MKNKKAQIVAILSNPIVLLVILIASLFFVSSGLLAILNTFEYAGLTWTDSGSIEQGCNVGGVDSSLSSRGETFSISGRGDANSVQRYAETDLKELDEVLIIYEGSASAYSSRDYSAGGAIYATIIGTEGGQVSDSKSASVEKSNSASQDFKTFPPSIWKFRNNFDGTWSSLQSLGVGDVFIEKGRETIKGVPKLRIGIFAGVGCGNNGAGSASNIKIYNIIGKENSFAICKADQFAQDKNGDGKIQVGECVDLDALILQHEEAFQESQSAQFLRLQEEQQAKVDGLTKQVEELLKLNQDASTLKSELDDAKKRLAAIEAKDGNVIATIEGEESFKEPSSVKSFFNRIIAWFRNLF